MNTQNSEEGKCLQAMYRNMCAHVILRACANGTWPARLRRACDAKIKVATSRARSSCVLPQQLRARSLVELDLACEAERRRRASKHSSILEARSPSEHASSAPCLRPQICGRGVQVLGLDTRKIHCVLAPGACFQENCVLAHLCRTRPYEQATGAGKRASTQTLRKHPSPANMVSASLDKKACFVSPAHA